MILIAKSLHFISYCKYFYITNKGKNMTVEEYVSSVKRNNHNAVFSTKLMSQNRYQYRGFEYRFSELVNTKARNMVVPSFYYNETTTRKELLGTFDVKVGYLTRLQETLDRYLRKARYETIKASTILDIDFLNADVGVRQYGDYYLQRCYNAENAIYTYYSVYEILMQMVWIAYDYYDKSKDFQAILQECSVNKLSKRLSTASDTCIMPYMFESNVEHRTGGDILRFDVLDRYRTIRDWCNNFKHRGILRFDGEKVQDKPQMQMEYTDEYKEKTGVKDFCSNDFESIYIDLDKEVIPELIKYHGEIMTLAERVIALSND